MNAKLWPVVVLLLFAACSGDDTNPIGPDSSLNGRWRTNGIYVDMDPNDGSDLTLTFNGNSYSVAQVRYTKDSSGSWKFNQNYSEAGTFSTDNSFLVLNDSAGALEAVMHYVIEGNTLTVNSTADHGGIFQGNSNELTGHFWTLNRPGTTHAYSYFYNANGSGMFLYDYRDGSRVDTVAFTYSISANVLTLNWLYIKSQGQQYSYDSQPYLGVYEIKNNKLYMYGKPKTRDNDDYFMYELYRQ